MNMHSYKCCKSSSSEFRNIDSLASLLKIVSDENRLRLLCLLRQSEHCVCEIVEHFEMSQSLISHHLADLKTAGLVSARKEGRKVFYSLTPKGDRISNTVFQFTEESL